MANYTSTHTGATIDASVTIVSSSGVTQSDLTKLNAVTSSAVELNLLDGVTASTAEINILDGLTATTAELNYLDGADSSITTLSLPDNTTITTFGASLIDDADAATARTTLGVDVAGTDNSTDVTLVTTSHDYLSITGQAITLGSIDISDDTNLTGGTGITLTGDTLSTTDSEIVHDNLSGFVANEHIDHSTVSISAGTGLSGGGDLTSTRTLSIDSSVVTLSGTQTLANKSISGTANTISNVHIVDDTINTLTIARGGTGGTTASEARSNLNVDVAGTDNSTDVTLVTTSHDYLSLSGQEITLGEIDISDDTNLVGGTGITLTGDTLSTTDSEIVHDDLSGFVSNEHIDHSTVSITAGTGLSGGGDITTSRTLTTDDSAIVHDNLSGFVANEHIDHSGVSITAGAGLTGGGDITATRDIAVGAGTGVTVNADDIAIGQDVGTTQDVTFNSVTADIIGDIRGATKFQAKADVALNKGDAVYISGVSGTTPTVDIADANDSAKMPSFGLAASSVSINASVEIITFGTLAGLNTSGFSVGDILFISTNGTSGNTLTATAPSGESSLIQNIGIVQRSHASAGSIKVGGAGRTNATPNLDDGDIFIGNGSNQAVTAALNTKIQDYLNTGVNLPSPTFSGDIDFSDANTPQLNITDTTNTVTTRIQSQDSSGTVGTTTAHNFGINRDSVSHFLLFGQYTMHNSGGNDIDFRAKDSSGNVVFKVDAGTSTTEIGTLSVTGNSVLAGDLQVNGTTTTVNQTNLDVSDNIIGLNRGAASNANDSGLIIERGSTGDNAAIIWDESADKFTLGTTTSTPSATGNLSVSTGTLVANVEGDVTGAVTGNADTATTLATARNFSLTGDVTAGAVSFDGSGNVALSTTIAANSVALGTDTTGNYMSDLTEGTGIDISHTPGEGSNGTITLDLTEVGFGGGANRLITDDGDGTVTAESALLFSGSTLEINNTGDWSSILNNTNSGGLRFGSKDSGGTLAYQIEASNTGNYVKLNEDVQLPATKKLYLDGGSDTYIHNPSGDTVDFVAGGQVMLRLFEGATDYVHIDDNVILGIGSGDDLLIYHDGTDDIINTKGNAFKFLDNGTERLRLTSAGNIIINENGNDQNLRVEGNTDASLFFVDAGTDRVGIGTNSPNAKLVIDGGGDADADAGDASEYSLLINQDNNDKGIAFGFNGADNKIGAAIIAKGSGYSSNNKTDLQFYVKGTTGTTAPSNVMTLQAGGNVGIGTTSPGYKLDVSGQGKVTNGWLVDNGTTAGFFTTDSDNVNFGASTSGKGLKLYSANTEAMRIDSSGNVLIGRTSAFSSAIVEIQNDATEQLTLNNVSTDGKMLSLYNSGSIVGGLGNDVTELVIYQGTTEAIRIDTSQNVGIGTTSPSKKLEVAGDVRIASGGDLILSDSGGGNDTFLYNDSQTFITYVNGAERLRINSSGNVGIGTTSPSFKLKVNVDNGTYTDIETIAAFQSKRSADSDTEAGLFINAIGDALGGQISSNYYYTDNVAARGNTGRSGAIFGMANNAGAAGTHSSFYWQTSPNNSNTLTDRMQLDTNGNLKLFDNTANPSASTNNAFIFCDSGEMKVLDELGNTTTISPHNFDLIPGGASEDRAWGYYSEKDIKDEEGNVTATQKVNVDMMKLARLVEQLTGEKLVYTEED